MIAEILRSISHFVPAYLTLFSQLYYVLILHHQILTITRVL